MVKEFPDVFPEELRVFHPEREVDLSIKILPGITPISKTPYWMAPTELKELKIQLQRALRQGISPTRCFSLGCIGFVC